MSDDLGFDKVEGQIKLIKQNGSYMQIHFEGHKPGGKGPQELAEYIAAQVREQLPSPPSEVIALKNQIKALEKAAADRDAEMAQLKNAAKRAK